MSDYRSMFGKEHLGSWDLLGKDVVVTIKSVRPVKIKSRDGEKTKPVITFEKKSKTFVCNVTNAETIAKMYGKDTTAWIGKRITLYPTTTTVGVEKGVDCVRVRPVPPRAGTQDSAQDFATDPPDSGPTVEEIAAIRAAEMAEAAREPGQEG